MVRKITINDLEALSLGSAVLGSGGGGDPAYALMMAKYQLEKSGPFNLISMDELEMDDFVIPISMMGAPLITKERIPSGKELETLLDTIENTLKRKPTVLLAAEIGGANCFTPLLIASKRGIPLLDADMIGRAFPELQMSSCFLASCKATPAVMADCLGNSVILETKDAHTLENIARHITVAMGSCSFVSFYMMNGKEAKDAFIPNSFSHALFLGKSILDARTKGEDPVLALVKASQAKVLGQGTLVDINQEVKRGFLEGDLSILTSNGKIKVSYQNEYLLVKQENEVLASTPDLLVLLEENTATPLMSESLRYGLQVVLIAIPAPKIWQSKEGLKLVGPRVFGYDIDYKPIGEIS